MNLDIKDWGEFKISKLFTLENGKANQGMLEEGNECFYVGAKKDNNGVMIHCAHNSSLVQKGNCIIFICNGQGSVGYANYMDIDFIGTTDIVAGYNKNLNSYNGLFIATVLCMERPKYSFGRKWKTHLKDTVIKLPIKRNADKTSFIDETHKYSEEGYVPDWEFMENYIKSLHSKPLTTKNKNKKIPALNVDKWKEFKVSSVLSIKNGKGITKEEIEENPGDLIAVQSGEENNGVLGLIDKDYCKSCGYTMFEKSCLTVARSGSAGFVSFQPDGCVVGDSAKILYLEDSVASREVYLFIQTILTANRFKYAYGRKVTEDNYMADTIKLPIQYRNGKPVIDKKLEYSKEGYVPDWQFMEDYIKALPYGDRI